MKNKLLRNAHLYATALIVLFACLFAAPSMAASDIKTQSAKVTITVVDKTVRKVIELIEQQTDYLFVYNKREVNLDRNVSIDYSDATVKDVLTALFASTDTGWKIEGNNILLMHVDRQAAQGSASAQKQNTVTGVVKDAAGQPVAGASVLIAKTGRGVVTDADGRFAIAASQGDELTFSFLGYVSKTITVGTQNNIAVTLEENQNVLDEVVVVGFGVQKKSNLTGAVSQVQMDKVLGDRPVTSLGSALQGAIPGFTTSSGVIPGSGNSFNIRGLESINGGSPLILVDNVVFNDLFLLNPADIESVSVLKDASSAAIYGARASFGVVLITTKKAKKQESLTINYNNNFAISKASNLPQLASPIDMIQTLKDGGYSSIWSGQNIDTYLELLKEYQTNPSKYPEGYYQIDGAGARYFLKETDIMTCGLTNSFKQTHNISASGGSETIQYRLSLGYTDEDGILKTNKDSFTRYNVSSFVNGQITKWLSTSLDVKYSNGNKRYPYIANGDMGGLWSSILPSYHPTGTLMYDGVEYRVASPNNLLEMCDVEKTVTDDTRLLSRTVISPVKTIQGVVEYSYQASAQDYELAVHKYYDHQGLVEAVKFSSANTPFTTTRSTTKYSTLNAFVNYDEQFARRHNVSAVVGYNQEYNDYRYIGATAYNMISDQLPSLSGSDGSTPPDVSDSYNQYALRSAFGRVTYNYAQRYFVEFNGRYDLSSKFPKASRAGFFPSVSAAWNITNESFMQPISNTLSQLKLRFSYGTLGNQNIGNYGYLATLGTATADWIYGGLQPTTLNTPAMVRGNYTWETVETYNAAIEFGLFKNRLTGQFDLYRRYTLGMLGPSEDLPSVAGATAPTTNSANMKTNGWELEMNWNDRIGAVRYGLGFNLYDQRTWITKYKNETLSLGTWYVGQEYGEIWGYVTDGFYTADDFNESGALRSDVVKIQGVNSSAGDIKFKNLRDNVDADGNVIADQANIINTGDNTATNPGDRKVIGNSRARLQYGINGFVGWKGFDLSFRLQGVGKRDAWIGGNIIFPMSGQYGTVYADQVGKIWTVDNQQNAYYGRIYENAGNSQSSNQRTSDKFLSDASYLRLKNITLSYTIPQQLIGRIGFKNLKVFVSGENLWTYDHLPSGIDPESLGWTYPHYATVSFGINFNL